MRSGATTTVRKPRARREQGAALIVALGVLGLLSALAIAGWAALSLERRVAANGILEEKARLAAEAGVQRALAELSSSELDDPVGVAGRWVVSDPTAPLEEPRGLSWLEPSTPLGPCSGVLGGTLTERGDHYLLRVADTSARIDINAREDVLGPLLDVLGRAIATESVLRGSGPQDPVRGRGAAIAAFVSGRGGLASTAELSSLLTDSDLRTLEAYVTAQAVRDPATVRLAGPDERGYPRVEPDPRAPVCVNSASWPVLVATFAGVTGLDEVPVTESQARGLAQWIVSWRNSREVDRGPIATWETLAKVFASAAPSLRLSPAQLDALLANASPNVTAHELNPDAPGLSLGDAGVLRRRTTELALVKSGVYEVQSVGRILDASGQVAASREVRAALRIFESVRHSSQRDFANGVGIGTTIGPQPLGGTGSAHAGWVQLTPRAPIAPTSGALLDFSSGALEPRDGDGRDPKAPSLVFRDLGSVFVDSPWLSGTPDRATAESLGPEGTLHRDGFRAAARGRVAHYSVLGGGAEGRVAFWLKLGGDEHRGILLDEERALTCGWAVRGRLVAGRSGDTLSVEYERWLVRAGAVTTKPRWRFARTVSRADLAGLGSPREWHRIACSWRDATEQTLSIDGVEQRRTGEEPSATATFEDVVTPRNALTIGGELTAKPSACEATIDGLIVDGSSTTRDDTLDRYGSDGTASGVFRGTFGTFATDVELGTISWTALRPARWGRYTFREDEFALASTIDVHGVKARLLGNGAPVSCGKSRKPGGPPGQAAKDATRASALPRIVYRGGSVDYEFEFLYDRSRRRTAPPLAVSPILEDVTLTFSRGARVLRQESRD